jgi:transcriptional regulator with XRE-family HTH domain
VLERVVDAWGDDLVDCVVRWIRGEREPALSGMRAGQSIRSALEPTAAVRAQLADDLAYLRQTPALPVQEPGQVVRNLASLLGDRLNVASLCDALGLPQPEVMKLLRGKLPLSPDQINAVAAATGIPAEEVACTVAPLPVDLVRAVEHPRWRTTWVRRARRLQVSEAQVRLSGAYGAFALAARQTGGAAADWDARLRRFLRDEGVLEGQA